MSAADASSAKQRATSIAVWLMLSMCAFVIGVSMLAKRHGMEGEQAPAFALPALGEHEIVRSESLRGQVVLIDFWATWCPPCKRQMPIVQRLADDPALAERGVKILSINVDDDEPARRAQVQRFMAQHAYTMTTLLDDGTAAYSYRVSSIPTLVIIDRAGKIHHISGGVHEEAALRELIDEVAQAPPPSAPTPSQALK